MDETQKRLYELEIESLKSKINLLEIEKSILINQLGQGNQVHIIQIPNPSIPYYGTYCSAN